MSDVIKRIMTRITRPAAVPPHLLPNDLRNIDSPEVRAGLSPKEIEQKRILSKVMTGEITAEQGAKLQSGAAPTTVYPSEESVPQEWNARVTQYGEPLSERELMTNKLLKELYLGNISKNQADKLARTP